jgi:hypothetical protein
MNALEAFSRALFLLAAVACAARFTVTGQATTRCAQYTQHKSQFRTQLTPVKSQGAHKRSLGRTKPTNARDLLQDKRTRVCVRVYSCTRVNESDRTGACGRQAQ